MDKYPTQNSIKILHMVEEMKTDSQRDRRPDFPTTHLIYAVSSKAHKK